MPPEPRADVRLPEVGTNEGLAYARYMPDGAPRGAVLILHGAGGCKESHYDFARVCGAAGLASVLFDQRGHGDSEGAFGPGVFDDIVLMAGLLPRGVPVFLRGSSMGGLLALASAERVGARAVVAICPATPDGMARGITAGRFDFRAAPGAADVFAVMDPEAAAISLGPDLLLMHADGDDRVPVDVSARLHGMAHGSRFERVPGGTHHSVQHDMEMQARALKFLKGRAHPG